VLTNPHPKKYLVVKCC